MEYTLKLKIVRNGKEEIIEKDLCNDIPFDITGALIDCLDLDFSKVKNDLVTQLQLLQKVGKALNKIQPIILHVFPELTEEDLKYCGTKQILGVAMKAILFILLDCYGELKNDLMAGTNQNNE